MTGASPPRSPLLGWIALGFAACSPATPRAIAYGRESCAHCHMTIADPRFAGELVTAKGRIYTFDDVECLASFATGGLPRGEIHSLWVNDFLDPARRLEATRARYWRSERWRTPMSSGLVAVRAGAEADSLAAATGATLESWEEVLDAARRTGAHRGHPPVAVTASPDPAPLSPAQADLVVEPGSAVPTLTAALQAARPHARILVRTGTYREPTIVVDKPVTIVGDGWPTFVGGDHPVFAITGDSVTLRGVVIRHVAPSAVEDRAGIQLSGVRGCAIENNRLFDTFFGIYLAQSSGCRVAGNFIRGQAMLQGLSGNAIHSWNSSGLTIEDNDLAGHRDGIYLEFTTGSRVRRNRSEGNLRYGLHFMFSHHCEYADNEFSRNGAGVAVMFSDSVTMRHNRFERNQGSAAYGLLLKELRDSRIEQNRFRENTVGLWTEGTSRVSVTGNDFVANGWALRVLGDATDNWFRGNRFVANSFDVGTSQGENSNRFEGNYWDHYHGYDLDHDGYGDVPFQPVRLFSQFVQESEPALILLHSFFIDLLDLAERVAPALTPATLVDRRPLMRWRT